MGDFNRNLVCIVVWLVALDVLVGRAGYPLLEKQRLSLLK